MAGHELIRPLETQERREQIFQAATDLTAAIELTAESGEFYAHPAVWCKDQDPMLSSTTYGVSYVDSLEAETLRTLEVTWRDSTMAADSLASIRVSEEMHGIELRTLVYPNGKVVTHGQTDGSGINSGVRLIDALLGVKHKKPTDEYRMGMGPEIPPHSVLYRFHQAAVAALDGKESKLYQPDNMLELFDLSGVGPDGHKFAHRFATGAVSDIHDMLVDEEVSELRKARYFGPPLRAVALVMQRQFGGKPTSQQEAFLASLTNAARVQYEREGAEKFCDMGFDFVLRLMHSDEDFARQYFPYDVTHMQAPKMKERHFTGTKKLDVVTAGDILTHMRTQSTA